MNMTDPVADLLARIRNALMAKHDRLDVPLSSLKQRLVDLLKREGFIEDFEVVDGEPVKSVRIYLRYTSDGAPAIRRLARISRPGRRVYRGADDVKPVLNGLGVAIISTSMGLLTDREAREKRIGGEVLCEVW